MTVRTSSALGRRVQASSNRTPLRGYAASRQAYDRRRRQRFVDPQVADELRAFQRIVRADPCSFCIGVEQRHPQVAADHIDPLEHGGTNEAANLTAACRRCNASKKDKRLLLFLAERRS